MTSIPSIELASQEEILEHQRREVITTLNYAVVKSPFYQKRLAKLLPLPSSFSWDEFRQLPATTKDDLQQSNWDFLCVPKSSIVEYTSTSGTLGIPVTIALTEKDLVRLAYNESISFACADGGPNDLYQLMLTLDRQFMAGIAYYEGIRKMGAGIVRVGPGLPQLQWDTIQRLQPTALVTVPSFLIKLIEFAQVHGWDLNQTSVKKAICIGEAIRTESLQLNRLGTVIKSAWNIDLFGTYASTEMQTAFTECKVGRGGHLHPELIYIEILDDKGKEVDEGQFGEVTITTIGIEGMPLIRYRTGDIARLHKEPCGCGRTTPRLGPVIGRKQQMIKLKGTTLYPPAIFDLMNVNGVQDYVVEVFSNDLGLDEVKIYVSAAADHRQVELNLAASFQSRIRVVPQIIFKDQSEIDKMQQAGNSRKLNRFVDRRK